VRVSGYSSSGNCLTNLNSTNPDDGPHSRPALSQPLQDAPNAAAKRPTVQTQERAVEIILEVREMTWEWLKIKGPLTKWQSVFKAEFATATRNGTVPEFVRDWSSQRGVGLTLVEMLRGIAASRLPHDEKSLRDVIRQSLDLLHSLSSGIALIEYLTDSHNLPK
jgi:hypothetical protein